MMKTIFERETEIGKFDYECDLNRGFHYAEPDYAVLMAHTVASLTGNGKMLKIEQHCYLRHGEEIPEQPWIKPEIALEPALSTVEEMAELALVMHQQFCERARNRVPERFVA